MRALAIASLLVAACAGAAAPRETEPIRRIDLGAQHRGLSGLAWTDARLWAVAERTRLLLSFEEDGSDLIEVPIVGAGEEVDLESLAHLGGGRFAAGTEGRADGRATDDILIIDVAAGAATVIDRIPLAYARLGFAARDNQGIEGLCAVDSILLAGFETPAAEGDRRAPLARIDAASRRWTALWLRLTSETGKLAALDCRRRGAALEVLAVERHFEVVRVLYFVVPDDVPEGAVIEPRIAADLGAIRRPNENPEGIVWRDDRSAYLVLDNDFGDVLGPTELQLVSIDIRR